MEKTKRTIDDVYEMTDSRYSLVNAISRRARELSEEGLDSNDRYYRTPGNLVIDRLLSGQSRLVHVEVPPEEPSVPVTPYSSVWDEEDEAEPDGEEPADE